MSDLKKLKISKTLNGAALTTSTSPCSWMYAGYGLQVEVAMEGQGRVFVHRKEIPFEAATASDVQTLLDTVGVCPCKRCGNPAFDPTTVDTNRDGLCETCFIADLNAEVAAGQQKERDELARLDKKYKAEGCTHRVDATIHPESGGSDREISFWMTNPTDQAIKRRLRNEGSCVLDHFRKIEL